MTTTIAPETTMAKDLAATLASLQAAELEELETMAKPTVPAFDEDALLGELAAISGAEPAVVTQNDEPSEEDLIALQASMTRAEAYSTQTSEIGTDLQAPTAAGAPVPRKARTPGGPAKPRASRDLTTLPAETFMLFATDDAEKAKVDLLANQPKQVKVQEKFENLFQSLNAGALPSRYTVTAFKLLLGKGTVTSSDLVATMKAEGLKDGTARSQSGQVMALLPLVGVALRAGQSMSLRPDSLVAEKLKKILNL